MANRAIIDGREYFIGVDTGTQDRSAVSIIKAGDPDEQVASASWEAGNISKDEQREAIQRSNRERNLRCRKCGAMGLLELDGSKCGGMPGLRRGIIMAIKKPFTAAMFTPMQSWYTAQDKADFGNAMIRFIESDFNPNLFTDKVYKHLNSCFGHIAEFNRGGFYGVWFSDLEARVNWLRRITTHVVYGDPAYTRSDVERTLVAEIIERGYVAKYGAKLREKRTADELALLKSLQAKYPNVTA